MHTLHLWILCLLMPLLAPAAWAGMVQSDEHTQHLAPPTGHAALGMPCHTQANGEDATPHPAPGQPPTQHPGCGDCSACHVLALLPPDWQLSGPTLVQAAPGWHATPDRGRPRVCELYRPPRA